MAKKKHFGEHHQAQEHHKHSGHDGLNHGHHSEMNVKHGLPKDVFAHGGADYGCGNPHGGAKGTNKMGDVTQMGHSGGPVGPIGEAPEHMAENYEGEGDNLSET